MNAYALSGLGGGLGDGQSVATGVSAGAGVISSMAAGGILTTIGLSAQAVPVIGQVAGALALVAAGVARLIAGRKIAKQLYAQQKELFTALQEIKKANADADNLIVQTGAKIDAIKAQLKKVGLAGLD